MAINFSPSGPIVARWTGTARGITLRPIREFDVGQCYWKFNPLNHYRAFAIEHARWYSRRSKSRFPDSSEKTSHGEILMSNLHVHSFASNESFFLFPVLFLFIDFHTGYLSRHGGGVTLFPILPFPHSHPMDRCFDSSFCVVINRPREGRRIPQNRKHVPRKDPFKDDLIKIDQRRHVYIKTFCARARGTI